MTGGGEAPEPRRSRVISWLVRASSTLYAFINPPSSSSSSSAAAAAAEPQHRSLPDKSTQGGSDQAPQPIMPPDQTLHQQAELLADIEARNDLVLASPSSSNSFNEASPAAPPEDGFDNQPNFEPTKSSNFLHLHPNTQPHHQPPSCNLMRNLFSSSLSSEEPSPPSSLSSEKPSPFADSPTKHSPNSSSDTKAKARVTPIQSEKKSNKREPILYVKKIIDKQELGKHILGLTISMGMGLIFSSSPLAKTFEMHVVAIALSCAFAAIWNGILLRKTYPKASTLILISGIALITLAFYTFVACFLPLMLKWIPVLCWFATLYPLVAFAIAFLRKFGEVNDPEKGKTC